MGIPDVRQNGIQLLEGDNLPGDVVIGIEAIGTGKDDTSPHFHYLDRADDIFRLVKDIDPNAFISQSNVVGVYGEGFDKLKIK